MDSPAPKRRRKQMGSYYLTEPTPEANLADQLQTAAELLQQGDAETAVYNAEIAHDIAIEHFPDSFEELTAMTMLGQCYVEAGNPDGAWETFQRAAELDPEGRATDIVPKTTASACKGVIRRVYEDGEVCEIAAGGGPEVFLWLGQLAPEGCEQSLAWYERGTAGLRRQMGEIEDAINASRLSAPGASIYAVDKLQLRLEQLRTKLCQALCGMTELYMTDLSFSDDAEARCEALVAEALMVCPNSAEALQTLANVRISQERYLDAKEALRRSLQIWGATRNDKNTYDNGGDDEEEDEEDESLEQEVPAFDTRLSLARLLIEVEMRTEALQVLERLHREDDEHIEVLYLGGWAHYLEGLSLKEDAEFRAKKERKKGKEGQGRAKPTRLEQHEWVQAWRSAQDWINDCLKVYERVGCSDEALIQHAEQISDELLQDIGPDHEGGHGDDDYYYEQGCIDSDSDRENNKVRNFNEVEDDDEDDDNDDEDGDKDMKDA